MIVKDGTWGGGIELSILSQLNETELCSVEIRSGKQYIFGEGQGFKKRAHLIFDGLHYDPVQQKSTGRRVFEVGGVAAEKAAKDLRALGLSLKTSGKYTDLAGFSLRCGTCGMGMTGQAGAVEHAKSTQHANFFEYK